MAAKTEVKARGRKRQANICELTGKELPELNSLVDTDRRVPKAKGGVYTDINTRVVDPVAHMERHGNVVEREEHLEVLKRTFEDRQQVQKLYFKLNNQLLAYTRKTDKLNLETIAFLESQIASVKVAMDDRDSKLKKAIMLMGKSDPFVKAALGVRGVGPISVACCTYYINLETARHASCLWSYAGLHVASHERYVKGTKGGGNKTLRTVLYTMTEAQVKSNGAYRKVYDDVKHRLSLSDRIIKTRNTEGKLVECAWKDAKPSHRHGAALRAVMKHFLADYWYAGREIKGMTVGPLYPEAMLGGEHRTIMPKERGWIY